jgi:lipoprotein-anchoring transpeptidase ErfK/SrfK
VSRDRWNGLQNLPQNWRSNGHIPGQTLEQTTQRAIQQIAELTNQRLSGSGPCWRGPGAAASLGKFIRGLVLGAIREAIPLGVALFSTPALGQSFASETYPVSTHSNNPTYGQSVPVAPLPIYYNTTLPDVPPLWNFEPFTPEPRTKATHLVLSISQRRVFAYQYDTVLGSFPVAVGKPSTPTPTGEFAVFEMIEDPAWQNPWTGEIRQPGADSALGVRWIGFAELPNGVIGFHGTPTVSSIGQAASNGCVRLRNEDVLALYALVEVGTPVRVEP